MIFRLILSGTFSKFFSGPVFVLQAFPGWPKAEEILLLVKFSYVVTLIQVLLACSGLEGNASINVLDLEKEWGGVVQHTCLPFLRRAALLVLIFPSSFSCFSELSYIPYIRNCFYIPGLCKDCRV